MTLKKKEEKKKKKKQKLTTSFSKLYGSYQLQPLRRINPTVTLVYINVSMNVSRYKLRYSHFLSKRRRTVVTKHKFSYGFSKCTVAEYNEGNGRDNRIRLSETFRVRYRFQLATPAESLVWRMQRGEVEGGWTSFRRTV